MCEMSFRGWNVLIASVLSFVVASGIENNKELSKQDGADRTANIVMVSVFGLAWVTAAVVIAERNQPPGK